MDPRDHQYVPMGTVSDLETRRPKTVFRDFDTALIPACRLDEDGISALVDALAASLPGVRAYKAEVAAEADEDAAAAGGTEAPEDADAEAGAA